MISSDNTVVDDDSAGFGQCRHNIVYVVIGLVVTKRHRATPLTIALLWIRIIARRFRF